MGYIAQLVNDQAALMAYIDIFYSWSHFRRRTRPARAVTDSPDRAGGRPGRRRDTDHPLADDPACVVGTPMKNAP